MKRLVFDAERVGRWVVERAGGKWRGHEQAIGLEKDGVLVAGVMYNNWTGVGGSVSMHQRIDGKQALTREFVWVCFDYPFNQLKVGCVYGLVEEHNEAALKMDEHLGFKHEARLHGYFPTGDAVLLRMTREECRFLDWRKDHVRIQDRIAA